MKNIVKTIVIGLLFVMPLTVLGGCSKRCGEPEQRLEKMQEEYVSK